MGSILVNDSPTLEFKFYKGLKQGNPLSPFLFIQIIESLHLSFKNVVNAGLYKGLPIDSSLTLSHLFYADDAVFVANGIGIPHEDALSAAESIRGGNEEVQFQLLRDSLANVLLPQINDRWVWKLESSGDFLVKSARSFIDDKRISDKRTKNQAKTDKTEHGMEKRGKDKVKVKVNPDKVNGNMEMEPDIENMTISEYLEYEAAKERRL
ncbi:hypothetical protein Tco_0345445 [Tanacetum coccineum]